MANDVQITTINKTDENTHVVIFQQDPDLDKIFDEVFPTAWQVFQLGKAPKNGENGGRGTAILPIQYQIGAGDTNDAFTGHVSYMRNTDTGEKWKFTKEGGFYVLEKHGSMSDNSIGCVNRTGGYASMSLVKNDLPLLTYPRVGELAQATFLPINYIYVAWYTQIVEGSQIRASIGAPQAVGVNLDGAETIEASLLKNANTGQRSWEVKVNGQSVPVNQSAVGRHLPGTVTDAVPGLRKAA